MLTPSLLLFLGHRRSVGIERRNPRGSRVDENGNESLRAHRRNRFKVKKRREEEKRNRSNPEEKEKEKEN